MGCGSVSCHDELGSPDAEKGASWQIRLRDVWPQQPRPFFSGSIMLGKSLSPFPKPPAHAQLIRRGAYTVVRHSVYADLIALSLGWVCL
jgi:hypothetical protein